MAKTRFEVDEALGIFTLTNPPLNLIGMEIIEDIETVLDTTIPQLNLRAILLQMKKGVETLMTQGPGKVIFTGR